MIAIDETLDRRLSASLRQCLSVAMHAPRLPSHVDLRRVADAIKSGELARATRDLDRIWRCHPDDSVALAPIYGRLLALSSEDHYATLRLLQHALDHHPDADLSALLPLSYLRLGRIDDAHLHLQRALSDYCTSPASLLFAVAGAVVRHTATPGWVGRGPRLELIGELSAGTPGREIECRGGARVSPARVSVPHEARRLFRYAPADRLTVSQYDVVCGTVPLLGSGAALPANFALDGRTSGDQGTLAGWARLGWHPQRPVRVTVENEHGARAEATTRRWPDLNGQWPFLIDLRSLKMTGDRFRLLAQLPDGRWEPLADSPLLLESAIRLPGARPGLSPAWDAYESPSPGRSITPSHRPIRVIIPIYRGREEALACIESVLETVDEATQVVVVDDATSDQQLAADLDALALGKHITLLRNETNLGFVGSVNRAAQHPGEHDLVLLNSDTVVFGDWLARLRAAAYSDAKVGSVTPLSNNGSIASYPRPQGALIEPKDGAVLHALASMVNSAVRVAIPVGVGFCLFLRRDCWEAVGELDAAAFGKGYGEETDFCMRARHKGWSHQLAADVFVYHAGGSSFGSRRAALLDRSQRLINLRHPGYDAFIASFEARDPLQRVRRRLDEERLRRFEGQFVLLATLALTGGVERFVSERCADLRKQGLHPMLLRPSKPGNTERCELWTDAIEVPNLSYEILADLPALATMLKGLNIARIEIQHFLDLDARVIELLRELELPYDAYVHDYTWICPRVTLIDDSQKYCGEPAVEVCEQCVAKNGATLRQPPSVSALRARSARWLKSARRVVTPSIDTAERLQRYFPDCHFHVRPHTARIPSLPVPARPRGENQRVAIIGAIGEHKGYEVLLECARDAQVRRLPLEFVVIGHSQDDAPLLATGKVFITGRYGEAEAQHLIAREQPDIAWFPSVWPETWCYALDYALGARLPLAAFDMGALAERIQAAGDGLLLPLNLRANEINDRLLGEASNDRDGFWPARRNTINMLAGRTEGTQMIEKFNNESPQPTEEGLGASVQILPLPAGLYLFSVKAATPFRVTTAGYLTLPAVHVGLGPGARPEQVEFVTGPSTQGAWLFAVGDQLVAKVQGTGVTLVLTSVRAPGGEVLSIAVERLDGRASPQPNVRATEPLIAVPEHAAPRAAESAPTPAAATATAASLPLQIGVHVRSRGDLNSSGFPWAGRVAPGLWIESFSVRPLQRFTAADIEYKGLTGSGFETPWLSDDKVCGTKGMAVPLVGFAIRLKPNPAVTPAEYDCEYSGYFQSGVTVGPLRNGAPCRSTVANDPLEGMQVRIVKRMSTALPAGHAWGTAVKEADDISPPTRATRPAS